MRAFLWATLVLAGCGESARVPVFSAVLKTDGAPASVEVPARALVILQCNQAAYYEWSTQPDAVSLQTGVILAESGVYTRAGVHARWLSVMPRSRWAIRCDVTEVMQ
jgi:hypothetical protein